MRKILLTATAIPILCLASCTPVDTTANLNDNANTMAAASPTMSPAVSPSAVTAGMDDNAFTIDVAQNGIAEVELGQLAAQKAQSPEVKQFAQRLIADHTRANNELKQIATSKNVTLPTEIKPAQKETHERLSRLTGAEFDREFMAVMVESHDRSVNAFQDKADNAADADIKAFATKTLPTLQEHFRMARELRDRIS